MHELEKTCYYTAERFAELTNPCLPSEILSAVTIEHQRLARTIAAAHRMQTIPEVFYDAWCQLAGLTIHHMPGLLQVAYVCDEIAGRRLATDLATDYKFCVLLKNTMRKVVAH